MSTPRFIVVEGLDGAGKSTIARALATTIGATLLHTPHAEVLPVRGFLEDAYEDHPLARTLWYASTVAAVSDQVTATLARGGRVVCDRYLLSTLVYAERRGAPDCLGEVARYLRCADVTVYLHVRPEVRRARIEARAGNSREDHVTFDPAVEALLDAGFRRRASDPIAGHFLALDSSDATPDDLVRRVCEMMGG